MGARINSESLDSLAPAHLKLVRFPTRSPLPIAALPSMSLFPNAPFGLSAQPINVDRNIYTSACTERLVPASTDTTQEGRIDH
jgi:hypothetical protein